MQGLTKLWTALLARKTRVNPARKNARETRKLFLELLEDRTMPSTVTIAAIQNGAESGVNGVSCVTRDDTTDPVTVNYMLDSSGSTAASGTDFSALSGSVTIPQGASTADIVITPIDAHIYGGSKTVTLALVNLENTLNPPTIGTPGSATLTIADDDVNPVSLTSPGSQTNYDGGTISLGLSATDGLGNPLTYSASGLPGGLSINGSTGTISGLINSNADLGGPYSVTVTANDTLVSASATQTFAWALSPSDLTILTHSIYLNWTGDNVSEYVSATGVGTDTVSFSANGLPAGVTLNSASGLLTGTISANAAGDYHVTFTATDSTINTSTSTTMGWSVLPTTLTVNSPGGQTGYNGDSISVAVTSSDSAGHSPVYSASGLPWGLSINPGTGLISGVIPNNADMSGPYTVVVTATDSPAGVSDSQTLTWEVDKTALTASGPGNQSNAEGDVVSLSISATDSGSYSPAYTAINLPLGLSINTSTGLISGTVIYPAAESFGGVYNTTVIITDGDAASVTLPFTWTISPTLVTPVPTTPGDQTSSAGQTVSLSLSASNPDHGQLTFEVSGIPAGLSINSTTGLISGTIALSAASPTPYVATFYASNGVATNCTTFQWTVNAATSAPTIVNPGSQVAAAGDAISLAVSASDTDGLPLTFTATGLPSGLAINPVSGNIVGTINNSAASTSANSVTVSVSDGIQSASATFSWTVGFISISNIGDQTNLIGDTVSGTISATDASGGTMSYSATNLPAGLSIDSSSGLLSGTISTSAAAASPYATTITASDGSHSATMAFSWTVAYILLANPGTTTNHEGMSVSLALQASDDDASAISYSASGLPTGLSINSTTGVISGTVGNDASGSSPYSVTVTASAGGYSDSQSFIWVVPGAVALANPGKPANAAGSSVSLSLQAASLTGETLSYSASGLPTGLSIDSSTGLISGTISPSASSSSPYWVTVGATDGTSTTSQTFIWTVQPIVMGALGSNTSWAGASGPWLFPISYYGSGTLSVTATGLPTGLSVTYDGSTQSAEISGTLFSSANTGSPYMFTITVTDGTNSTSANGIWTISSAILIQLPSGFSSAAGDTISYPIQATDAASPTSTVTFSATGLPTGLSISASGVLSGTIDSSAGASSPYSVAVTASDGTSTVTQDLSWTVSPFLLANPGTQTNADNQTISLALAALNPNASTLTFSATGMPPGLSIDSATGVISGTLSSTADARSAYLTTVTATDGTSTANQTFVWNVQKVALSLIVGQTSQEGASVSLQVTGFAGSGTVSYTATGLPTGLTINSATGEISGTIAADGAIDSPTSVTIGASNGSQATSVTFSWVVTPVVSVGTISDATGTEGGTITVTPTGTDANASTLGWTATGLPVGLTINPTSGTISGTLSSGDFTAGPVYSIEVTASDGTYSTTTTFNLTVSNPGETAPTLTNPNTQSNHAGDPVSLTLAFTVATGDQPDFTATGLPDGLYIDSFEGTISGTVAGDAVSEIPYSVTVRLDDGEGGTTTQSFYWYVSASSLAATAGSDISATAGTFTGILTLANFTTPGLNADDSAFTAVVTWGDGQTDDAAITGSNGTFSVVGGHTYAETGAFTISISLINSTGSTSGTTLSLSASVTDATMTLTGGFNLSATAGESSTELVAFLTDNNYTLSSSSFTATIDWGDGSSSSTATITPLVSGQYAISGTYTYASPGTYTISISTTDPAANDVSASSTMTVGIGAASILTLSGNNVTYAPNVALSNVLLGTFTDPNPSDTAASFSVSMNWGDGSSADTSPTITGGAGVFSVFGDHTFTTANAVYTTILSIFLNGGLAVMGTGIAQPQPGNVVLSGPAVVPGNSAYTYSVPNLPTVAFTFFAWLSLERGNGAAEDIPNTTARTSPVGNPGNVTVNFFNVPAIVWVHASVGINGITTFYEEEVSVVQVNVVGRLTPYGGVPFGTMARGTFQTENSSGAADSVTLSWTANVSLNALDATAISAIQVGFMQHVTFGQWQEVLTFPDPFFVGPAPSGGYVGTKMAAGQPAQGKSFLDASAAAPWYSAPPAAGPAVYALSSNDTPTRVWPTLYGGRYLTSFISDASFDLDVAATIAANQSSYWAESRAQWSNSIQGTTGLPYTGYRSTGNTSILSNWTAMTSPSVESTSGTKANDVVTTWRYRFRN